MKKIVFGIIGTIVLAAATLTLLTSSQLDSDSTETAATNQQVTITTNKGIITAELYEQQSPLTVENFLNYVDKGFYDFTIFHRVIPDFMIQGGGYTPRPVKKQTNKPIQNEADNGLKNTLGTLSMARTNDPHSATSQFFINTANNSFLDANANNAGYAVFGKVTSGMDVVRDIEQVQTSSVPAADWPVEPVIIESIRRSE